MVPNPHQPSTWRLASEFILTRLSVGFFQVVTLLGFEEYPE
ncbi:hypothetical protein MtrunA17_Chr5g0416601 [Medicago truncatula]|uniref:Uncharacterized protein n=1 Tax=Medicago truncatula TaxID=3880 RepID=A0A396HPR7_MEDTR|nr:hypothetical protein MtrunA17_Chr5g0416601 [Medicago truncatula]